MFETIKRLMPQFVTEYVGCCKMTGASEDDPAYPIRPMDIWRVSEDGYPDCIVRMKVFSFLGIAFAPKMIGEPLSYSEFEELLWEERV